jgi:hypothetical protein
MAEGRPKRLGRVADATLRLRAAQSTAWNAPGACMPIRHRLVRAFIKDSVADVDDEACEIVLVNHWQGGRNSQLRIRKPNTGKHDAHPGGGR